MRRLALLALVLAACAHGPAHITVDGAVLGRVVIYRNGVAFYERTAKVQNGRVSVKVPRDRVDDFLKSLTVVDPHTRKPLAVSIPRQEADDGSYLTMTLETDQPYTDVLLTYVTESPAWKPSYRVVVGGEGKVMLEGWAIVDNVSGEDWKGVLVGVGASSALSFRYDLWSVRRVDRDLLAGDDRFAIAPPAGVSPYAENIDGAEELVSFEATPSEATGVAFSGNTSLDNHYTVDPSTGIRGVVTDPKTGLELPGVTVIATANGKDTLTAITNDSGAYTIAAAPGNYVLSFYYGDQVVERKVGVAAEKVTTADQKIKSDMVGGETIAIEDRAPVISSMSTSQGITIDRNVITAVPMPARSFQAVPGSASDRASPPPKLDGIVQKVLAGKKDVLIEPHGQSSAEVAQRAEVVKNKLVDDGIPATRIHIVPRVGPQESISLRVLAVAPNAKPEATAPPTARSAMPDTPVGESHFMVDRPMNVRAGTSAMVAMVHGETTGGVVYLYDPISDRGDRRFAFKAVRLDNPTDNTLEPGPVTVYGDGRFIGEGITEAVPPQAAVVVPFALDRQVIVTKQDDESDRIAKLVTVQRGIVTAEIQHRRQTRFTVTSRLTQPTKVYLRHRLESGWALVEAPSAQMKVGDSQLFEVDLAPGATAQVTIIEATPLERSLSLDSSDALDMMKVFIDEPNASPELKKQIHALLETHKAAAALVDQIATSRDALAEYRSRAGELHAQLVTLKLVKTSGELMTQLKTRLAEINERIQKATLAIVDTQEKLMLARLTFANQLADLHLGDVIATSRP